MSEILCKICNIAINSRQFKKHLLNHNISEQAYYDTYIEKHFCPICGKETKFKDVIIGYNKHCSRACLNKSSIHKKSVYQTKLERYGDPYYSNKEKIAESKNNWSEETRKFYISKRKNTMLSKYGNMNNSQKYKETCLSRYGVTNPFSTEQVKKKISDKYQSKSDQEKQAIYDKRQKTFNAKSKQELKEIGQKHSRALLNKSEKEKAEIKLKRYLTYKKNHSFKTSKTEIECYNALINVYPNTKHNYKSESYPFMCDLYIPEVDTYIELNFHWTHGGHRYNKQKDKNKLCVWIEKSKTSKYFKNAIDVWTRRDIQKFNIAKKNKLKYLAFYTKSDFDSWLSQLQ